VAVAAEFGWIHSTPNFQLPTPKVNRKVGSWWLGVGS
jgi:hypothetical protein